MMTYDEFCKYQQWGYGHVYGIGVYRGSDYSSYEDAAKDGAVYFSLDNHAYGEVHSFVDALMLADKCVGAGSNLACVIYIVE